MGCTLLSLLRFSRSSVNSDVAGLKRQIEEFSKELREVKDTTNMLADKVDKLAKSLSELSKEVSKLSDVVGFVVEDVARMLLPFWLSRYMGIKVENLNRAFFEREGRIVEVDLFGEGIDEKNGGKVLIIGEVKSRIHGNDVKTFHEKTIKLLEELKETRTPLLIIFGLYTHPTAEMEAKRRGVLLVTPYNIVWNINSREQCEIIRSPSD
ncbi:MAG: hypothetical protein LM567_03085 [Desulfurococcaceae archaeon]|nr:hypothetical protein [Desulfurococcaceae archaeon]